MAKVMESVFSKENTDKLSKTCKQIDSLISENVDGALTISQMWMLMDRIQDFVDNPIIKGSGVIKNKGV